MNNFWYPIAWLMKAPEDPIYAISDQILIFGFLQVKFVAAALVVGLIALYAYKQKTKDVGQAMSVGVLFTSLITPFLMTQADENHLYLFSAIVALFVSSFSRRNQVLIGSIVILSALNLVGLYWNHKARWYSEDLKLINSLLSTAVFFKISYEIFTLPAKSPFLLEKK